MSPASSAASTWSTSSSTSAADSPKRWRWRAGARARHRRDGRQHDRHGARDGARARSSASCARSSISTARSSCSTTARPACVRGRHGLVRRPRVGRRSSEHRSRWRLPQQKDWFGQPRGLTILFLTEMWEQLLLLRHARAARLLHDEAAAARAGERLAHLRRVHRVRVLHADRRRHRLRPLARQAQRGDASAARSWRSAIS